MTNYKDDMDHELDEYGAIREAPIEYILEHIFNNKGYGKLIIQWGCKLTKNYQILQLKKICPMLKNFSSRELYDLTKNSKTEWEFAIMGYGEGQTIVREGNKIGLQIRIEKIEK